MSSLSSRVKSLESSIPEKQVIFFGWQREPDQEITKVTSDGDTWLRDASESEQGFLERVRKEIRPSGPHPQFGFVE